MNLTSGWAMRDFASKQHNKRQTQQQQKKKKQTRKKELSLPESMVSVEAGMVWVTLSFIQIGSAWVNSYSYEKLEETQAHYPEKACFFRGKEKRKKENPLSMKKQQQNTNPKKYSECPCGPRRELLRPPYLHSGLLVSSSLTSAFRC